MRFFPLAFFALYSITASAQTNPSIVLQDVRVIDGTGAAPLDHVSLVISEGKISKIITAGGAQNWPDGATVMKLSGKTVMPGLIAGHAHLGLTKGATSLTGTYTPENIERQLAQYERYGVTTVMSLGMNKDLL